MPFSYKEVTPGTILSSQDWNDTMKEIVRLESAKLDRNGSDTFKGSLTIAEALSVNGYVGIGTPATSGFRLDIKGNLRVTEGSITANFAVKDTRNVNDPPTAFGRVVSFDFKDRTTVGVPGEGTYSGMLTIAPWSDNSGDAHHQLNFNEGGIFWRQGQPASTSWNAWCRIPHEGMTSSFTTQGNLGIGLTNPAQALVVNSSFNSGRQSDSGLQNGGAIAIRSNAPQIDFIDTDHKDWAIHVNSNKLYFIREPWEYRDLVLDGAGRVGIGTDAPQATLDVLGTSGTVLRVGVPEGTPKQSTANIDLAGHIQLKEYGTNELAYLQARDDTSNRNIGLRIRTQKQNASAATPQIVEAVTIEPSGNLTVSGKITTQGTGVEFSDGSVQSTAALIQTGTETFPKANFDATPLAADRSSKISTRAVIFSKPFANIPTVVAVIQHLDCDKSFNLRINTSVANVTKTGFNLSAVIWADTIMWAVTIRWIAFAN